MQIKDLMTLLKNIKKNFLEIKNIYKSYKLGETNFSSFTEDVKVFLTRILKKKIQN